MVDPVALNVEGLEPLINRMDTLSVDVRKKGGRFAMRKAANLIRDKAKENASQLNDPESAADIAANVAVRFSPKDFKRNGNLVFRVGVMGGAGGRKSAEQLSSLPGQDTRHWRQQEFGNKHHPAQPFMRRALSENIQAATNEFVTHYNKALDRAIKRAQRQP